MEKKIKDANFDIDIDAIKAQHSMELLSETLCNLMDECEGTIKKQPHIRIEFDSITEVPDVFVDGVKVAGSDVDFRKSTLSKLFINWNTDTDIEMAKQFEIKTLDSKGIYNEFKQENFYGDDYAKSKTL